MELNSLQIHFNKLVDEGIFPSVIKRKMVLTDEQYKKLAEDYVSYQEFKAAEAEKIRSINRATVEELAKMWDRIEIICFELRIEKDYEKIYALEKELEELTIKYSESQFKKI